ncbi:MAG: Do family serine endopeptidase [Bacteroidota bacterium]
MKRSILAAFFFITIGIIFGAVLVSDMDGVHLGFAQQKQIKIGSDKMPAKTDLNLQAANDAFVKVSKEATPAVVYIAVTTKPVQPDGKEDEFFRFFPDFRFRHPEGQTQGAGSGVVVTKDGYIITNNHVVENAADDGIDVVLNDSRRFKAKLIGTDPLTDVAVIKIDENDLPVAMVGNSDEVQVGQWALAIGNPLGLNSTVTAGIISYMGRGNLRLIEDAYGVENFIQTDAAVNPGNSGGALVNIYGEVIGINTAIATTNQRYQGYSFAIPINLAKSVATDLILHGKVERGYIGVSISQVDETLAKANGLEKPEGVFVQEVIGEAAKAAGVKEGDIILTIDGKPMKAPNELQAYIASKHPGDKVTLAIWRDERKLEKVITLRPRSQNNNVAANEKNNDDESSDVEETSTRTMQFDKLGFAVRKADSRILKDREISSGLVITSVKEFGEGANRGLREGDIIVDVDKKPVGTVTEFEKMVKSKKAGDALLLRVKGSDNRIRFVAVMIPKG